MRYRLLRTARRYISSQPRIAPASTVLSNSHRSFHHSSLMSQKPEIISVEEFKTDAKWLKLESIKYKDQTGKERTFEAANRTTRKSGVDSVHIFTILEHPSKPPSTILIEQFRPPAGGFVIEFPAGLVDEGEDAETAALRELHEETGYGNGKAGGNVTVEDTSSVMVKDPGMTGANFNLITIKVKLSEDDVKPEQHLDEGEHITTRIVPLKEMYDTLQDYAKKGYIIDGLVGSVAMGYKLAGRYALWPQF